MVISGTNLEDGYGGEGTFQLPEVAIDSEWDLKLSSVALAFSLQPDPFSSFTFIIPFLPLRKGTGIALCCWAGCRMVGAALRKQSHLYDRASACQKPMDMA